jgi:hypothetical protein
VQGSPRARANGAAADPHPGPGRGHTSRGRQPGGWEQALAGGAAGAHDVGVTTPSRSDRHAARLARLRTARLLAVGGVGLGLAAGVSLLLFADEQPIRVIGVLVLALNGMMALVLPALLRAEQADWRQRRRE